MASKTLHGHDFPDGTVVAAYPRENLVNGGLPSGVPVDSSAVAGGALTFDGLTAGRRYVAYAAGRAVSFFMEEGSLDLLRPIRGEEAAELRESVAGVPPAPVEGFPEDLQMLAYQQATGKYIHKNPFFVDPVDGSWGSVGTAVDSRPAIQAALNFAICGNKVDPALPENGGSTPMTSRRPLYPVKFGPRPDLGNAYRVDSKLKAYAVDGLVIEGMGALTSQIRAGSVGQDYVLDVNGCHGSTVRDISFGTHGAATVTAHINHDCISTVAKNSGSFATYENIWFEGNYKYAAQIGASGASNAQDCYHSIWKHCNATGGQRIAKHFTADTNGTTTLSNVSLLSTGTNGLNDGETITGTNIPAATTIVSGAGTATLVISNAATGTTTGGSVRRGGWDTSATLWQAGFKVGGAFGAANVLSHTFHNCQSQGHVHGVNWSSVGIRWRDGNTLANQVDFFTTAMNLNDPSIIEGVRSESSEKFLIANGGTSSVQLSVRDIAFYCIALAADATPIRYTMGGQFILENFNIIGMPAARIGVDQVLIKIAGPATGQSVDINGLLIPMTVEGKQHPRYWLDESSGPRGTTWTVRNVKGYTDASTVNAVARPIAGPLSNRDRTAPLTSFPATLNGTTLLVSGSSTASANVREGSTIAGTNIPAATTIVSISGNNITMSAAATGSGAITAATVAYPTHPSDKYIGVVSTVTGGATVNLPAIAAVTPGHEIVVKDESGSAATNNITLDGSGAETIDGAPTLVINTNYGKARVKATATAWVTV